MWKGRLGGCCFVGLFEGDLVAGREIARKGRDLLSAGPTIAVRLLRRVLRRALTTIRTLLNSCMLEIQHRLGALGRDRKRIPRAYVCIVNRHVQICE